VNHFISERRDLSITNSKKYNMQTVKGTRDLMPEDKIIKDNIIEKIRSVSELYGFQPIETPALESWEILSKKGAGGENVIKEAYDFKDKAGRRIGLRYDLTVSLARVIASNPNMILPFKRYQTGKIWRYDDISKGRLREFSQADIDIVGSESMLADAEIILCALECLEKIGFDKFYVRLNNRKILTDLAKYAGVKENKTLDVLRIIDKFDKIGTEQVKKQMEEVISKESVKKILDFIKIKGKNDEVLKKAEKIIKSNGIGELKEILSFIKEDSKVRIDLSLARGLDYYTGPIYEVFAEKGIGSIAAGGRYDKLIGLFLKRDVPATGISFGIDRIIEVMKDRKMMGNNKNIIFVAAVNDNVRRNAQDIVNKLRKAGKNVDYDLRDRKLSKQLEYASSIGSYCTVIVGEKELRQKSVKIRNMKTGKEEIVKISQLPEKL
jgi:histidyl-tRNA synthetase